MYNYFESVKKDVENFIDENIEFSDFSDRDELEERLNEILWTEDSVTGNASGSYTFDRSEAAEYVNDNIDLLKEACSEFGVSNAIVGEKFLANDFEYFDVTIRCYVLSQAIADALDELNVDDNTFNN